MPVPTEMPSPASLGALPEVGWRKLRYVEACRIELLGAVGFGVSGLGLMAWGLEFGGFRIDNYRVSKGVSTPWFCCTWVFMFQVPGGRGRWTCRCLIFRHLASSRAREGLAFPQEGQGV